MLRSRSVNVLLILVSAYLYANGVMGKADSFPSRPGQWHLEHGPGADGLKTLFQIQFTSLCF